MSNTGPDRPLLLLVEDDDALRRSLQLMLYNHGFDVRAYPAAANALADPLAGRASVLLADYRLPDCDGIDLLRRLQRTGWTGRAVLVTGFRYPGLAEEARRTGYDALLEKPVPHHRLIASLGTAIPAR